MKASERLIVGFAFAAITGGIAAVAGSEPSVVCGWVAIGFGAGVIVDFFLAFLGMIG